MQILIVCPYFPPENVIAAIRIAKFAQHWAEAGHDVKVLARTAVQEGLDVPSHRNLEVIRVRDPLTRAAQVSVRLSSTHGYRSFRGALAGRVKSLVKSLAWPDVYFPWSVRAWGTSRRSLLRPDVVVASTGPFSSLLLGSALARRYHARFVVDYRDMLATGPYYEHGRLRRALDLRFERFAASNASLIAGVSQNMVDEIKSLHARPTILITNGYDPKDFEALSYEPTSSRLHIVHCGTFYPGIRDASPLFRALRLLLDSDPTLEVSVDLYGRNVDGALASASSENVAHLVNFHGSVGHDESLRVQAQADLLLLVLWNDPREIGVLSGKLFEYIGAQRPILMLGLESGDAASIIRENDLGLASNDAHAIRDYLERSIIEKRSTRHLVGPGRVDHSAFTRRYQSEKFLREIESLFVGEPRSSST